MRRGVLAVAVAAAGLLSACSSLSAPHPPARSTGLRATSVPASSASVLTPSVRVPAPPVTGRPSSAAASPTMPAAVTFPGGSGPVVVLNPGHNGGNANNAVEISRLVPAGFGQTKACDTTGTNTDAGYSEHAFNWDVTMRVRAILQAHGVRVVLTRPNDSGVGPCVDARAAIGNARGVAAVISIHADGAPPGGRGFQVCEDSLQPAGAAVAARSQALGVAEHNALSAGSGLVASTYVGSNGYFPRSDLAGLNLATVPATFLELGNMRNAGDAALQTSAMGRQRIAAAVAAGILAYLRLR